MAPLHDDPQTLNRYAYARHNPVFYNDPSGNEEADAQGTPTGSPSEPLLIPDSQLRPGGYYDPFGHWHAGFCQSCHDGTPAADFHKQQAQLANLLDWKVIAYQQLLGAGLSFGIGVIAENVTVASELVTLRAVATTPRLSLPLLEPAFVPDATKVLQNITNAQNAKLTANPQLMRSVLYRAELESVAAHPGLGPATYGKALGQLAANEVRASPLHSMIMRPVGGASQPDFVGVASNVGMNFDITTPRAVAAHLARPGYGPGLNVVTSWRPPNLAFPAP